MADRYPISQFPDLHLPGFGSEATLQDVIDPATDWQPVFSLSIYSLNPDAPDQIDVLTAIRSDDTETHPHVVSTPTGRFPKAFEAALVESREKSRIVEPLDATAGIRRDAFPRPAHFRLDKVDVRQNYIVASYSPNIQSIPDRSDPLTYLTHEVLARKLGLGEVLQKKKDRLPIGTISLSEVIAGFSYAADDVQTDEPLWEPLMMYAGVMLLHDRSLVPDQTSAYRNIGWTDVSSFIVGHMRKRAEMLVPTLSPADEASVCVRGLCLTSTGTVTLGPRLKAHLGLSI